MQSRHYGCGHSNKFIVITEWIVVTRKWCPNRPRKKKSVTYIKMHITICIARESVTNVLPGDTWKCRKVTKNMLNNMSVDVEFFFHISYHVISFSIYPHAFQPNSNGSNRMHCYKNRGQKKYRTWKISNRLCLCICNEWDALTV